VELTTKPSLARAARTLAESFELVQHGTNTYMPAHWLTEEVGPCDLKERIWLPMSRNDKKKLANVKSNVLFANDSEVTNFDIMLRQFAHEDTSQTTSLLVRTVDGLRLLNESGSLVETGGEFYPNVIQPMLNDDLVDKKEVFDVIAGWLNSEEEAHSLLYHLSTSLSPGWSAVKYLLLIGDGRNGKSVLLLMLQDLYGQHNISNVTRQQMAERLPVCTELNDKLLNIIFDGEMSYIKDSSMEKTLIAGEPGYVRLLYENGNTKVQTNALFLEALNKEPKTRDKSGALQKRLARFFFPNTYDLDMIFEKHMRSEKMLGAFLSLLLDHFVQQGDVVSKLKQTSGAAALQVEQTLINSPIHQFVSHLVDEDPVWSDRLIGGDCDLDPLVGSFMAWRIQEGFAEYSTADAKRMFRENFDVVGKSVRENGKVVKKQKIKAPKAEIIALLNEMKVVEDETE
jgi:hypothetical protein